ncbi:MAG: hypothetical protein QOF51_3180 [Chloroflexota bacterium]|jgi:transcriptional regulator with XRE-family HTH domain|nr:hypothetical protein [Chloroflexota bacterium]
MRAAGESANGVAHDAPWLPTSEELRDRLRDLVAASGLSQAEIARRLGEEREWVNNRLRGKVQLAAEDLPRFAAILGVGPAIFFEERPLIVSHVDEEVSTAGVPEPATGASEPGLTPIEHLTRELAAWSEADRERILALVDQLTQLLAIELAEQLATGARTRLVELLGARLRAE